MKIYTLEFENTDEYPDDRTREILTASRFEEDCLNSLRDCGRVGTYTLTVWEDSKNISEYAVYQSAQGGASGWSRNSGKVIASYEGQRYMFPAYTPRA